MAARNLLLVERQFREDACMNVVTKRVFLGIVALTLLCFILSVLFYDWLPLAHSRLGGYVRTFHYIGYLLLLLEGWLGHRLKSGTRA